MAKLNQTYQNFLLFLQNHNENDEVTEADILNSMPSWSSNTLKTYLAKNKIDPFVKKISQNKYLIIRNGGEVTYDEVSSALTQANPKTFTAFYGVSVQGKLYEHKFISKLGAGAIGAVWKGKSSFMGDEFDSAIKFLSPREDLLKETSLTDIKRRFKREAKNGKKMNHKNIIKIQDHGEYEGTPFLTMELAKKSVSNELKEINRYTNDTSIKVILACLDGLNYLHSKNLIHRDIKPANILLTDRDYVIGDLGKIKWTDFDYAITKGGTLTNDSMQLGSWYYMAPEQRDSPSTVTSKCDIYALGITWYEILTGEVLDPAKVAAKKFPNPFENLKIFSLISTMCNARLKVEY